MTNYEICDLIIKLVAVLGTLLTVMNGIKKLRIGLDKLQHSLNRSRYAYMNDLYEQFLSIEALEKRRAIATKWSKYYIRDKNKSYAINISSIGFMANDKELNRIIKLRGDDFNKEVERKEIEILNYLRLQAGIQFISNLDDSQFEAIEAQDQSLFIDTESLLDRYEHLGKLHKGGAITDVDIKLFFYTMIADTFILTLPYILLRRKTKPQYAYKMQSLIQIAPYLSGKLEKE